METKPSPHETNLETIVAAVFCFLPKICLQHPEAKRPFHLGPAYLMLFHVLVLPATEWDLPRWSEAVWTRRAAFCSMLSSRTTHLRCVYADIIFVVFMWDVEQSRGLGSLQSCSTLSVTAQGTQPMSLIQHSLSQPQILLHSFSL